MPRRSEAGRFVVPRDAKGAFKTHCDHTFGGQVWFDVLNQIGGCPAEFVDAWNAASNHSFEESVKCLFRKCKQGDVFHLLGIKGLKPVSKFFWRIH